MIKKALLASSAAIAIATVSFADRQPAPTYPELSNFVAQEVKHAFTALNKESAGSADPKETIQSNGWQFSRFFIETYAKAGFHIPFLLKVEIYPELDLIWEKKGFAQYP